MRRTQRRHCCSCFLGVAKNQKYITQKKLLELQGKLEEIGRIIGGLQKFFINNRK